MVKECLYIRPLGIECVPRGMFWAFDTDMDEFWAYLGESPGVRWGKFTRISKRMPNTLHHNLFELAKVLPAHAERPSGAVVFLSEQSIPNLFLEADTERDEFWAHLGESPHAAWGKFVRVSKRIPTPRHCLFELAEVLPTHAERPSGVTRLLSEHYI